jgi:hypothetical protein
MQQVLHRHGATVARSEVGGGEGHVLDVAATELELSRHEIEVHVARQQSFVGPDAGPDAAVVGFLGERKVDREGESAHEGVVDLLARGTARITLTSVNETVERLTITAHARRASAAHEV